MDTSQLLLELRDITKTYPGVKALSGVNFKLRKGTVHSLMGENGAGKSTLMKILAGIYKPDEGNIILRGQPAKFENPRDALQSGISMIHQELSPIPEMTIAENIYLGREPLNGKSRFVNFKQMTKQTNQLFSTLGLDLNPVTKMKELSVSEMQMVEIAKAISYNADVIIMDEPTSAITDREVEILFKVIKDLKQAGKGIIYISHKMDEIFQISDEITVLRDGRYIGTKWAAESNNRELISMMVGRELEDIYPKEQIAIQDVVLSVRNITRHNQFEEISFDVKSGEILGVAGLMGAGRTEIMHAIFGDTQIDSGEIHMLGNKVRFQSPKDAIRSGIALVTEDRKGEGLVLPLSIRHNTTLPTLDQVTRRSFVEGRREKQIVDKIVQMLRIKAPSPEQKVQNLSGGNQQKVVLGKWMLANPKVLILDEPTRGIDIGAKSEIYKIITDLAKQGMAIIMISSELPELIGMSDRILVVHRGRIAGELWRDEVTQEKIMLLATGHEGEVEYAR